MPICKVCGKDSFWTVDVASKICKECKKKEKSVIKEKRQLEKEELKKENQSLSQRYSVLESYKSLAFLLMIASTGFFIYALVQFFDLPELARKSLENTMITSTVLYAITMFSLFCLTKIIDFLFELDLNKSDKK